MRIMILKYNTAASNSPNAINHTKTKYTSGMHFANICTLHKMRTCEYCWTFRRQYNQYEILVP